MKMDLDFETVLDVALGGPEVGPLNLHVLHGLMKEVFRRFDLSEKSIIIEEKDTNFSDAYNFIKGKMDERKKIPHTSGGGYSRDRSKVSVIISDYVRSPIGKTGNGNKGSTVPADLEDRLRYVESELKTAQHFPTADELRVWAQEKTSPDTVVTDLWHFVSLNSRMNGAEEGIQKLSELVDKLIPELKKHGDEQQGLQGQIDDLNSQLQGLSDRATKIDNRISNAGEIAAEKVKDLKDDIEKLNEKMGGYAKLIHLEDFLLADTFIEEKKKAMGIAGAMQNDIDSKALLTMLDDFANQDELLKLADEVVSSFYYSQNTL